MRVLATGVDLEVRQLLAPEGRLGEHAADGLLHGLLGALGEELGVRGAPQAAREARVAVGLLLLELGAGEGDLLGVDDDDEVTTVDVRGEGGLVLAAQEDRGLARQATQDDVRGVDDVPGPSDLGRLRGKSAQCTGPLLAGKDPCAVGARGADMSPCEGARHNSAQVYGWGAVDPNRPRGSREWHLTCENTLSEHPCTDLVQTECAHV